MENFKQETVDVLNKFKKNIEDVKWCGSEEWGYFSIQEFLEIADFDYSSGFGSQKIAKDLLIVGTDWWLERREYDGSEWWEFNTFPLKPEKANKPKTLCNGGMWETLSKMNTEDNELK